MLAELDEELKKLNRRATDKDISLGHLDKKEMRQNLSILHAFLGGLEQLILQGAQAKTAMARVLLARLQFLKETLSKYLEHVAMELILSLDSEGQKAFLNDRFFYWQISNPLQENGSMDLLIKKDPKDNGINYKKTKIVMRFSTEDLGDLGVILDIDGKKIWTAFHTENGVTKQYLTQLSADLRDRLAGLNYELVGFQLVEKKLDVTQFLIPKLKLDSLSRVRTEI